MSFANHNILDIALSIIPPTVVQVRKNIGTKVNKYGQSEATYTEWIDVYGIVQPGAEQNEHIEGMDISKKRVTIWLRGYSLDGTHLQWAPDQIRYIGRIFNVTNVVDWFPYDNYRQCECVEAINIPPNQRAATIQPPIPKRRKVVPKSKSGKSVDNLNPQQTFDFGNKEEQPVQGQEEETEQTQEVPPPPTKNNSLVGKARIRF